MYRRYPRSIIYTLCITLALAVSATVLAGSRTPPEDRTGIRAPAPVHHAVARARL